MSEPTTGDATPPPTKHELEAEVARSRAELGDTLDQLVTRLSPSYQASQLARSTKQAAADVGSFVTGGGLPDAEPRRSRNAKILLGAVAAGLALATFVVVRAVRR
ncbi:hypothetical protein GCM10009809_13090 [Isoptericola hypogeus]|uniref:DUF3618 domain-containing protein n=1 Tax=Isoptericola hypogeus TaxID=300179 RepID=A0ABP4VAQ4_9MICO